MRQNVSDHYRSERKDWLPVGTGHVVKKGSEGLLTNGMMEGRLREINVAPARDQKGFVQRSER